MSTKSKNKEKIDASSALEKIVGKLTLGRAIRSIRICDEISQTDFAEILGVSRQYLCDLENGRKSVSMEKASMFAKALNYPAQLFVSLAIQDELGRYDLPFKVILEDLKTKNNRATSP